MDEKIDYTYNIEREDHWPYSKQRLMQQNASNFQANPIYKEINKRWIEKSKHQIRYLSDDEEEYNSKCLYDGDDDVDDDVNVKQIVKCLSDGKEFHKPIQLSTMVAILEVLWDED